MAEDLRTPASDLRELLTAAVADPILRLLTGRDELSRWSNDVARACLACVAFLREWLDHTESPRRRGRPLRASWPILRLRVEMTRDLLEREDGRRLQFSEALALFYVGCLNTTEPATATRIREWSRHYEEEEGHAPVRALIKAVRRVDGKRFASLESKLSQSRTAYDQDAAIVAEFWRRPLSATGHTSVSRGRRRERRRLVS